MRFINDVAARLRAAWISSTAQPLQTSNYVVWIIENTISNYRHNLGECKDWAGPERHI
jgi:hypothetical protein